MKETCHFQANFFTSTSFLCSVVRSSWVSFSKVRVQWCPLEQFYVLLHLSCCLVILAVSCGWHLLSLFLLKTQMFCTLCDHRRNSFYVDQWESVVFGDLKRSMTIFQLCRGAAVGTRGRGLLIWAANAIKERLKGVWDMSDVLCSCFYCWAVSTSAIVAILAIFICFRVNIMDEKLISCAELD